MKYRIRAAWRPKPSMFAVYSGVVSSVANARITYRQTDRI
jgi:hypothetical protein